MIGPIAEKPVTSVGVGGPFGVNTGLGPGDRASDNESVGANEVERESAAALS